MVTYWDAMIHEDVWVHDGDQLMQEVWLRVKQLWGQLFHYSLQLLRSTGRYTVPCFGFAPEEKTKERNIFIKDREKGAYSKIKNNNF